MIYRDFKRVYGFVAPFGGFFEKYETKVGNQKIAVTAGVLRFKALIDVNDFFPAGKIDDVAYFDRRFLYHFHASFFSLYHIKLLIRNIIGIFQMTIFTILLGTTIIFLISLPAVNCLTFSRAKTMSFKASSGVSISTSILSRIFPLI